MSSGAFILIQFIHARALRFCAFFQAPLLAYLSTWVEMKTDAWRLLYMTKYSWPELYVMMY